MSEFWQGFIWGLAVIPTFIISLWILVDPITLSRMNDE
jgi:hypothetical protein